MCATPAPETPDRESPGAAGSHGTATDAIIDGTHVSDEALATLIGLAAHEVPGVVGMTPTNLGEGIRRVLGVSQANEGVEIVRSGGEDAAPDVLLHVVVAYGVNIPVVAESIVERVRYAARHYGGVTVDDVKVHVAGVSRG